MQKREINEKRNYLKFLLPLFVLVVIFISLVIFPLEFSGNAVSDSQTYYVSISGNDSNSGNLENPWKTIQTAINNVNPGDKIIVTEGDYSDQGRIYVENSGEAENRIILEAEGDVKTRGFTLYDLQQGKKVNYIKLKGFEVEATGTDTLTGTGIIASGNGNIIENNIVKNSARQGIYIYAPESLSKENIIKNNKVSNSGKEKYEEGQGIFIYGQYGENNEIIGNEVYNNNYEGITIFEGSGNLIKENEVYGNDAAGIHIGMDLASENVVENNEVYENSQRIDDTFGIDLLRVGKNNKVRYNKVHDQYDTIEDPNNQAIPNPGNPSEILFGTGGIRLDGGNWEGHYLKSSKGNQIYYNIIYSEYNGIQIFNFENTEVYNNVVYGGSKYGLLLAGFTPDGQENIIKNNKVKNNIFHNPDEHFVYTIHSTENSINNNLYYGSGDFNYYNDKIDFESWKSQSGYDSNSIKEDPKFIDEEEKNFSLDYQSPAIDAGADVGLNRDYWGIDVPKFEGVDIGAFEFSLTFGSGECTPGEEEQKKCGETDEGVCEYGTKTRVCGENSTWGDWGDCEGDINPSEEVCDEKDNDCDGEVDEGVTNTYYEDSDGDGYGSSKSIQACSKPSGYVTNQDDCDDSDPNINPSAEEVCDNNVDDNCDGRIDEDCESDDPKW